MVVLKCKSRPRSCTPRELKKFGVEIVDVPGHWLRCAECQKFWSPMIQRGGKNPRGYWKCPNGCNQLDEG